MSKTEFLSLTDWKTGEPIYLSAEQISCILQHDADEQCSRYTTIIAIGGIRLAVKEEASQIALASGRPAPRIPAATPTADDPRLN